MNQYRHLEFEAQHRPFHHKAFQFYTANEEKKNQKIVKSHNIIFFLIGKTIVLKAPKKGRDTTIKSHDHYFPLASRQNARKQKRKKNSEYDVFNLTMPQKKDIYTHLIQTYQNMKIFSEINQLENPTEHHL